METLYHIIFTFLLELFPSVPQSVVDLLSFLSVVLSLLLIWAILIRPLLKVFKVIK
ncbi:MAG TPA: hypothetical protein PLP51_01070 [Acholeplasmataceae bacterium]|nr:hypothetical protein [Acholeplasmataceae bacterium]